MARSGVSAAQCLYELGARVTISDSKAEEKLAEALQPLEGMDIRRCLGDQAQPADLESYDLAVTSPGIPMQAPILRAVQAAGVPLIGELELGAQVSRAPLYAVTGTNGKTTTTTLIGEIFRNLGKTTYVVGNIGYPFYGLRAAVRRGGRRGGGGLLLPAGDDHNLPPAHRGDVQHHGGPFEPPRHHGGIHPRQGAYL